MLLLLIFIIFRLVCYIFGAVVVVVVVGWLFFVCLFVFGVQNAHINILDTANFGFRPTLSVLLHYIPYCICNHQKHIPLCDRLLVLDVLRSAVLASRYCLVKFSFFSGLRRGRSFFFLSFFLSATALKSASGLGTGSFYRALQNRFTAFFVLLRQMLSCCCCFCYCLLRLLFCLFFLVFCFVVVVVVVVRCIFACKDKLSEV